MAAILRSGELLNRNFLPEVESYTEIGHATTYILNFWSTF